MNMRKYCSLGGVAVCLVLLICSSQAVAQSSEDARASDVFIFINGGLGLQFTVINNGEETVQAYYAVFGQGRFVNKSWVSYGNFAAGPKVRTTAPPLIVPFSVMPITAFFYTNTGEFLQRSGISVFGVVLLVM